MMAKQIYTFLSLIALAFLLVACQSVAEYNAHRESLISPEHLRQDVDFAQRKIQLLHPQLYNYIAKEKLETKFDSLRQNLNQALAPNQFYQQLAPIISTVRQGHLRLNPLPPKYSAEDQKKYLQYSAFFRKFKFHQLQQKIYITESRDSLYKIPAGAELLGINQSNTAQDVQRLQRNISADGFNQSFAKNGLLSSYFNHFFVDYPLKDSLKIRYLHQEKEHTLAFALQQKNKPTSSKKITPPARDTSMDDIWDYHAPTSIYRRYFKYMDEQKSVAYLKISEFTGRRTKKFCDDLFDDLQKQKTQSLIIDLRGNPGGIEKDVHTLYAYLSPKPYQLIKNYQLASETSIYHNDYIRRFNGFWGKSLAVLTYPLAWLGYYFSVKEKEGIYYHQPPFQATIEQNHPLAFAGKIYVLCNANTFSAAGILAAQLKYDGLATLVGEETGAANDGTVAGFFSTEILPHSHLRLPIGLIAYVPNLVPDGQMAGVKPHQLVRPSLDDLIQKKDSVLDWVMADIKHQQKTTP
jgi:Peptidase family S41